MSPHLSDLLEQLGPWILLVLCAAETSFVTGLVVPASAATALGAFLASDGVLSPASVIVSAVVGAVLGDSIGFWLGRRFGRGVLLGEGRVRSLARRNAPRIARLFGRQPLYAVSLARTVSFVRTLMPWVAGMSDITYPRYLAYDLLGVAAWGGLYVGAGFLAGESWQWVSGALGTGWAVLFAVLGLAGWLLARRRGEAGPEHGDETAPGGPAAGLGEPAAGPGGAE